jgi:Cu/Zn superoxide dismutase
MSTVAGTIIFAEEQGAISVNISLQGLNKTAGGYHIHELPLNMSVVEGVCSAKSVGGHFNPSNVDYSIKRCDPSMPATCEVGDLSGKHGNLSGRDSLHVSYNDDQIMLSGAKSIVGKSIVIHRASDGSRWVCADIVAMEPRDPTPASQSFRIVLSLSWADVEAKQDDAKADIKVSIAKALDVSANRIVIMTLSEYKEEQKSRRRASNVAVEFKLLPKQNATTIEMPPTTVQSVLKNSTMEILAKNVTVAEVRALAAQAATAAPATSKTGAPTVAAAPNSADKKLSTGTIIGVVALCVVVFAAAVVGLVVLRGRVRRPGRQPDAIVDADL